MRLSTKGQYGMSAMYELARHYGEGPISIKEIASSLTVSDAYLEQLFALLKKGGLIQSIRGAKGGYQLSRKPDKITAGEIIDALEGPIELAACVRGEQSLDCEKSSFCPTKSLWMDIYKSIRNVVDNRTLQSLVEEGKGMQG